jgi:hypothetical protein
MMKSISVQLTLRHVCLCLLVLLLYDSISFVIHTLTCDQMPWIYSAGLQVMKEYVFAYVFSQTFPI